MVRLKALTAFLIRVEREGISIPYGAIKRNAKISVYKRLKLFQFLMVRLKGKKRYKERKKI